MSDPFIGEIKMFGGNFAIQGYAFCNGALLPIDQNDALFALIGTTYGGDGQTTFGLPNLTGRIPIHQSSSYPLGSIAGSETVTLTANNLPVHGHNVLANNAIGTADNPGGNYPAALQKNFFSTSAPDNTMGNQSVGPFIGGNQPHENMMPYLCITFIISLYGIYPTQN